MNPEAEMLKKLWPIAVIENRYGAHIGGGNWLAIGKATGWYRISMRVSWVLMDALGPHGDERDAVNFWKHPPKWIAAGATPEAAIRALQEKNLQ